MKRLRRRALAFVTLVAALGGPATVARAQSSASSGQIVGQVLDPTGAAVPSARVVVRNPDTGYTRETTTDASGRYAVSQIPLGVSDVSVSVSGFAPDSQRVTRHWGARSARRSG